MLLIFPKPKKLKGYMILGINIATADEIVMNENSDKTFTLALIKHFSMKAEHIIIGTYLTSEVCWKVFQDIFDSLKSGDRTFLLPPSKHTTRSDALEMN